MNVLDDVVDCNDLVRRRSHCKIATIDTAEVEATVNMATHELLGWPRG